ncbi:hypothetical protein V8C35DRAFT_294682 [Trichoderma chlorosporum]
MHVYTRATQCLWCRCQPGTLEFIFISSPAGCSRSIIRHGHVSGSERLIDDGLPEVVPDSSPQAMSRLEAEYKREYLDGDVPQTRNPKDVDTNEIAVVGIRGPLRGGHRRDVWRRGGSTDREEGGK